MKVFKLVKCVFFVLTTIFCLNCKANIDLNGVSQLMQFVNNQLGGWPIINPSLNITNDDVVKKMLNFHKYGLRPFVDVYVTANPKNSDAYILRVGDISASIWVDLEKDLSTL